MHFAFWHTSCSSRKSPNSTLTFPSQCLSQPSTDTEELMVRVISAGGEHGWNKRLHCYPFSSRLVLNLTLALSWVSMGHLDINAGLSYKYKYIQVQMKRPSVFLLTSYSVQPPPPPNITLSAVRYLFSYSFFTLCHELQLMGEGRKKKDFNKTIMGLFLQDI